MCAGEFRNITVLSNDIIWGSIDHFDKKKSSHGPILSRDVVVLRFPRAENCFDLSSDDDNRVYFLFLTAASSFYST